MTPETEIRSTLGLTEDQMHAARERFPDSWKKTRSAVLWTDAGIDALITHLSAQKEPAGAQVLTVSRIPVNPRVVFASLEGVEVLITNVRKNTLLIKGQKIRAEKKDGRWSWVGPHPVRRGQILVR